MIKRNAWALIAGFLFGGGLVISQMVDRSRVLGFLEVFGNWDPTLLLVMVGALSVTMVTFRFILRWSAPLIGDSFSLPRSNRINRSLIIGAAIFGIGWGLSGYCPGPGVAALAWRAKEAVVFLTAFLLASLLMAWIEKYRVSRTR